MDLILSYDPKPIDNSPIELSPALRSLVEMLARNNHDLWARGRMADGWKLGSRRDDERKETPLLVPYEDLPDFEKEYDRQNAVETLKTIFKLGGKIEMPLAAAGEEYEKYRTQGKKANQQGQALVAFDLADRGLKFWPRDCELLQIQALALARMGSTERAREILESLPVDPGDQETPGILARTYKDIWLRTGNAADLHKAIEQYLAAYRGDVTRYWTGINAATLLWAEGKRDEAARIANAIFRHCVELIPHAELKDRYWILATAAEAAVVAGDLDAAERFYAEAREAGEGNIGELFSTWRNARIVLQELPKDAANRIASVFRLPHVAVFAGDSEVTREDLARMNIGVGFAAAASDADIAFLEAVHERGGKTHLVLPCEPDEFVKSMSPQRSARFTAAVKRADEVIVTRDERGVFGPVAVRYANDVTEGLAAVRAAQYETELHRIGTRAELTDELITGKGTKPRLCSMLFADVKHFGALKEEQVPRFLREFFAPIGAAAKLSEPLPLFRNTWGDGFFFVFAHAAEAAEFALRLQRCAASIDLAAAGLPADMGLRIGIHAGPVFEFRDEILGRWNYAGSHVNRAARIEPITPEGRVYATEAFAALAALEAPGRFRFNYVGRLPLPKNFGNYAMYDLSRQAGITSSWPART